MQVSQYKQQVSGHNFEHSIFGLHLLLQFPLLRNFLFETDLVPVHTITEVTVTLQILRKLHRVVKCLCVTRILVYFFHELGYLNIMCIYEMNCRNVFLEENKHLCPSQLVQFSPPALWKPGNLHLALN
jgi:hypothetical protein